MRKTLEVVKLRRGDGYWFKVTGYKAFKRLNFADGLDQARAQMNVSLKREVRKYRKQMRKANK